MNKKYKIIIFSILIFLPIFVLATTTTSTGTSTGERPLEIEYPMIGGIRPETTGFPIVSYFGYIYSFIIYFIGTIALLSLVMSGLEYLTSLGNPEKQNKARERFFSVFLGTLIIFSSFIILNTVDLSMTEFEIEEITSLPPIPTSTSPIARIKITYDPDADLLARIESLTKNIEEISTSTVAVSKDLLRSAYTCNCINLVPICTYD